MLETAHIEAPRAGGFDAAGFAAALLAMSPDAGKRSARRESARNAREYAAIVASLPETIAAHHAAVVARCAVRTGDRQYAERCQVTASKLDAALRAMRHTEDREALIVRAFDRADLSPQIARDVADHLASWSARKVRAIADARANLARTPGRIVVCVNADAQGDDRAAYDVHTGPQSGRSKCAPASSGPGYDAQKVRDAKARAERESDIHARMIQSAPAKAGAPTTSYAARLAALRALRAKGETV